MLSKKKARPNPLMKNSDYTFPNTLSSSRSKLSSSNDTIEIVGENFGRSDLEDEAQNEQEEKNKVHYHLFLFYF